MFPRKEMPHTQSPPSFMFQSPRYTSPRPGSPVETVKYGRKLNDITDCETTQKVTENSVWDRKTSHVTTTAHLRCLVLSLFLVNLCYEKSVFPRFSIGHGDKQI